MISDCGVVPVTEEHAAPTCTQSTHQESDSGKRTAGEKGFKLSHKKWRRLLKTEKRKVKRQLFAKARAKLRQKEKDRIENDTLLREARITDETLEVQRLQWEEYERKRRHVEWLKRERDAVEQQVKQHAEEAKKQADREEQEKLIKEEWEKQQQREEEKSKREAEAKCQQEERLTEELTKSGIRTSDDAAEWHNPFASDTAHRGSNSFGTEKDPENCAFFLKTGACRFGDRCSRLHPRPSSGTTILIPNMFQDVRLSQSLLDEHDSDFALEYEDKDMQDNFLQFYNDVMPEFNDAGRLVQFKVCCNHEPHLRGNVYAQYLSDEEALAAYVAFNGRWYAGRQLSVQFSVVTKWKSAICGLFVQQRCPKGKNCNFLHVFRNPGNAFRQADRDFECQSSRRSDGNWSTRSHSRDPSDSVRHWKRSVRERSRSRSSSNRHRSSSRRHHCYHGDDGTQHDRQRSSHRGRRSRSRSASRSPRHRRRYDSERKRKHCNTEDTEHDQQYDNNKSSERLSNSTMTDNNQAHAARNNGLGDADVNDKQSDINDDNSDKRRHKKKKKKFKRHRDKRKTTNTRHSDSNSASGSPASDWSEDET